MRQLYSSHCVTKVVLPSVSSGRTTYEVGTLGCTTYEVGKEGVESIHITCLDDHNAYVIHVEYKDQQFIDLYVHIPFFVVVHYNNMA